MPDLAKMIAGEDKTFSLRMGQIASVESGTVTIYLGADTTTISEIPFLDSYIPKINDIVWILKNGTDLIIIGKVHSPDSSEWIAPTLTNGWVNYDATPGSWQTARYRRLCGVVYVQGLIKDGTLSVAAFTLPLGYRPVGSLIFTGIDGADNAKRFDVMTNGQIVPHAGTTNGYLSINCCFPAE